MLSYWGAIVTEELTAGFAMEFIGDMHDSTAAPNFSGTNDVAGMGTP